MRAVLRRYGESGSGWPLNALPARVQAEQLRMMFPRIVNAQYPRLVHASDTARDLLSRLLVAKPGDRLGVCEIMSHPWFLQDLPKVRSDASLDLRLSASQHARRTGPIADNQTAGMQI